MSGPLAGTDWLAPAAYTVQQFAPWVALVAGLGVVAFLVSLGVKLFARSSQGGSAVAPGGPVRSPAVGSAASFFHGGTGAARAVRRSRRKSVDLGSAPSASGEVLGPHLPADHPSKLKQWADASGWNGHDRMGL